MLAGLLLLGSGSAAAQDEGPAEAPKVRSVRFEGVEAMDAAELQQSIQTQPTHCRSILLTPFCLVSGSSLWKETFRLDTLEVRRDELRLRVFYFQRGYREATARSRIVPHGDDQVDVVFTVGEGEPTRVRSVAVRQADSVLSQGQIGDARLPAEGSPLDLLQMDSARIRVRAMLGEEGYLDAVVRDTALVDTLAHAAAIEMSIDPGRRATAGEIRIEGNEKIDDGVIHTALDIREGELLRRSRLLGSQSNLYETDMFRQVRVLVPPQADSAKLIEVRVREAPLRAVRLSAGFNTVDFVQTEADYTRYNFLGGGRVLRAQVTLGNLLADQLNGTSVFYDVTPSSLSALEERAFLRPTWQASLTLEQPGFRSRHANTVSTSLFAHRRTVPGIVIDRGQGASATFTRKLFANTPASLSYRFEMTSVEAGDVYYCINFGICDPVLVAALRGRQRLSPLALTAFSDRADNPVQASTGFRARLDLEHASAVTLSDFHYNRADGEYSRYFPLAERRVLSGRVHAGWVQPLGGTGEALGLPDGDALLHPRKRFYAGGARSVRGYGENQLGPRILTVDPAALMDPEKGGSCTSASIADGSCDPSGVESTAFDSRPLGGTRMIEASVEFRFPLWGPLDGAGFVDAGWVGAGGSRIRSPGQGAVTPGFGVRYRSPVGPIRVDLGIHPTRTERLPVVTEVVDADGARRLVQLTGEKEFDPLEGSGGLRRVLRRLTLHLSIGEAF